MWYVYILKCSDKTLYTGVTTDIERRLREHNNSKNGAKYTKARRPVVLMYKKAFKTRSRAQMEESSLKRMSRTAKLAILKKYCAK